jgi:hypothetical protein
MVVELTTRAATLPIKGVAAGSDILMEAERCIKLELRGGAHVQLKSQDNV